MLKFIPKIAGDTPRHKRGIKGPIISDELIRQASYFYYDVTIVTLRNVIAIIIQNMLKTDIAITHIIER